MRAFAVVFLALAIGCSKDSSPAQSSDDTGSSPDGAGDVGSDTSAPDTADANTDAGNCGETLSLGTGVAGTTESGSPPTFTGGSIADGIYSLTSMQFYGGAAPAGKSRITLKIESSATRYQAASSDDANPVTHACGPIGNATPKINFSGMGTYDGYNATPTSLVLMKKTGAVSIVLTYTKS